MSNTELIEESFVAECIRTGDFYNITTMPEQPDLYLSLNDNNGLSKFQFALGMVEKSFADTDFEASTLVLGNETFAFYKPTTN